ncbi:MAG: exonuclease subunit SbcD [Armatimonadetes bacterium]|nr:exonuclease subunit SbcD [Armatimonadota bacterium]
MRILHTADWHLNHRLGRVSLKEDLEAAVRKIAGLLDEHQVDVLLIAGDLFKGGETREQLAASTKFLSATFTPFLKRGGTVLAISGNHDSEPFFETLRDASGLFDRAEVDNEIYPAGRFYLAPNPRVVTLRDKGDTIVQFVLMPYPTQRAYLLGEKLEQYSSIEERNRLMLETYRHRFKRLEETRIKATLPAVLVAHAQVRGISDSELFQASDQHDVILDSIDLPDHFIYSAYGHIHKHQPVVAGSKHQLYSGSLLPLDAGESGQEKGVYLFEVQGKSRVGDPAWLPIGGPALHVLTIAPEEIEGLEERFPDAKSSVFKYILKYDPQVFPDPFILHQKIRTIFPRWYFGEEERIGNETTPDATELAPARSGDEMATILEYLKGVATYPSEEDKRDVITLAEQLLTDETLTAQWKG